jgi:hypothetical protein
MENETATKKDLEDLRQELRKELRQDMREMETRLKTEIVDRLTEFMREIETRLLTAFHGYGKGQAARMHTLEISDSDMGLRVAALEERVLNLETRRGPGQH